MRDALVINMGCADILMGKGSAMRASLRQGHDEGACEGVGDALSAIAMASIPL